MRRIMLIIGIVLILAAALWHFKLAEHWTQRIPPGWEWEANFIGNQAWPDEKTKKLPEKDSPYICFRKITIANENKRPDSVIIEDTFTIKDPLTGKITWQYIISGPVDPVTGRHKEPEHQNDYIVFPRDTEKRTYMFRANYVKGIPLEWQKEEEIEDVNTYVFYYKGRGEYTESYAGTKEYPGVKVMPGQEIKCADGQFIFRAWVEPVTGEIVKLQESCYSGDFIYETSTGKQIAAVSRWGGITAGDDVLRKLEYVRSERIKILILSIYLPAGFLIAGLLLIVAGAALKKKNLTEKP